MNNKNTLSMAEETDRFLKRVALVTFLVSVAFVFRAGRLMVDPDIAGYLRIGQVVFGLSILFILLPTALRYSRKRSGCPKEACNNIDGYMYQMFQKAGFTAFKFGFIFFSMIDIFLVDFFEAYSVELLLRVGVSALLGAFSISFFRLVYADSEDELDDEFGGGAEA